MTNRGPQVAMNLRAVQMFWDEQAKQPEVVTVRQLVEKQPFDLDEILQHDHCYQEVRIGSSYTNEFFSRQDVLQELLDRCIYLKPDPDVDPRDQYKKSPRAMGIFAMNNKTINAALLNNEELIGGILAYLAPRDEPHVNDVKAGFYKRLVLALLTTSEAIEGKFLQTLQESSFMDHCFGAMDYGAVAELIVRIPTQCHDEKMQKAIFEWYTAAGVAKRLANLFAPTASLDQLENASFIWAELEEMQLRRVDTAESFKDALYSVETARSLLDAAFPKEGTPNARLITYVAPILVYFLEVNRVANEPAYRVFPDLYMREPQEEITDPDFKLQSEIVDRAESIVRLAIEYGNTSHKQCGCGLASTSCLKILRALTNTNHAETHEKLAAVFAQADTSVGKLLEISVKNPLFSVFNNHLHGIIAHILYSNTEDKHPLVDALFTTHPDIVSCIIENAKDAPLPDETPDATDGRKSFFLKLGELLEAARGDSTPRAAHMNSLLLAGPQAEVWLEMTASTLSTFSESNRSYIVNQSAACRTLDEGMVGDIDEVATTERENSDPVKTSLLLEDPLDTKCPPLPAHEHPELATTPAAEHDEHEEQP